MAKQVKWMGETKCDVCHRECGKELYDAKTIHGPWATMCPMCYFQYGIGLGPGVGQRYIKQKDGSYKKKDG